MFLRDEQLKFRKRDPGSRAGKGSRFAMDVRRGICYCFVRMKRRSCSRLVLLINFDYINPRHGNPVKIGSSVYSSGTNDVTVTTEFPADVVVGDYVEIHGSDKTPLNGRFQVTGIGGLDALSKLILRFTLWSETDRETAAKVDYNYCLN